MIQRITIENFKSFQKAELPLTGPLTLLVGANASGKTNAVEAVRLLAWLGSGRRLEDFRAEGIDLRKALNDLTYESDVISLGCRILSSEEPAELVFSTMLRPHRAGLRVAGERLASPSSGLLYETFGEADQLAEARPAYGVLEEEEIALDRGFAALHAELDRFFFFDPDPRRMRTYSFLQEPHLASDGSALSSVLYRLCQDEGKESAVLDFVRSLPEQEISGVSFLMTPRGEVMAQLHESFGGPPVPREAAILSDGTLRVLALGAALLSVPEGSLVVIEEIHNLHPSGAEQLLGKLEKIARERQLRLLLTTHNPALLDALPLEAIPDVIACYRDPAEGDSRLIRLEDLESYPELVAQGPVGWLVTRGLLDRYLETRHLRDPRLKLERNLAWFADYRKQLKAS